jgi:CRISPR/Cas system-associated exonuclease Cas4 (RecB family)
MKGLPIAVEDVLAAFAHAWSGDGFLSREHEALRLEEGREALRRFVAREESSGRAPLGVEMDFKFRLGANLVKGRWDRLDEIGGEIVLVDYKSSDIEDGETAGARARASLRDEQLGLYALAYFETRRVMPARVQLQFIGSGIVGEAAVEPEHLERARDRIARAATGIRAGQFPPRPDQRNCGYCPYSRFCIHSAARAGT